MQNNNQIKNNEAQNNNPISQAATLAVIAGIITTLGDGLATVAAALAIQESQQQSTNNGDNANSSVDLQGIQQQLNYLSMEIKKIKKIINI